MRGRGMRQNRDAYRWRGG